MAKATLPPTREAIIATWQTLDAESADPVGVSAVALAMGISPYWIWKVFAGEGLTDMKRQHGIRLSDQERHLTLDELLERLDALVTERQAIPSWKVLIQKTGIAEKTWKRTVGGREGCAKEDVFAKYAEWMRATMPDSPNLAILARSDRGGSVSPEPSREGKADSFRKHLKAIEEDLEQGAGCS